jgi:hypothetical protein
MTLACHLYASKAPVFPHVRASDRLQDSPADSGTAGPADPATAAQIAGASNTAAHVSHAVLWTPR